MLSIATDDDLDGVYSLLQAMHEESGVAPVNEIKAQGVISQRISDGGCIIARNKSGIVGSVGIYKESWWYSDDLAFFDQWFFVHPKNRSEGHAVRLIAALKQAARDENIPFVLRVGTSADALAKLKFFKKHLTPFGGAFVYMPVAA